MDEDNQKINCSVSSCQFNDTEADECTLEEIKVEPVPDADTGEPDESMCGSYEHDDAQDNETSDETVTEEIIAEETTQEGSEE